MGSQIQGGHFVDPLRLIEFFSHLAAELKRIVPTSIELNRILPTSIQAIQGLMDLYLVGTPVNGSSPPTTEVTTFLVMNVTNYTWPELGGKRMTIRWCIDNHIT